jgi:hypothetical protein
MLLKTAKIVISNTILNTNTDLDFVAVDLWVCAERTCRCISEASGVRKFEIRMRWGFTSRHQLPWLVGWLGGWLDVRSLKLDCQVGKASGWVGGGNRSNLKHC